MSESIYERLERVHRDLADAVETLGEATYEALERETLRRVAIGAGIDPTIPATDIVSELGIRADRQAGVIRELRRQINAQASTIDRLRQEIADLRPPRIQPDPEPVEGGPSIRVDVGWFKWAMRRLGEGAE